ncbi:MAG TPA: class I SAM-dependent methyltransferase [Actinomycetota bacterium]|nr:class I SAM-dependent methyltransferase [Actinomycetota bacterium]
MTAEPIRAICRGCDAELSTVLLDLGDMPLVNEYPPLDSTADQARYPLKAWVCDACQLVQVTEIVSPEEIFSDYAYFSSYSESWLEHSKRFADWALKEYSLGPSSLVVEIASNDGYLLKEFMAAGIPVLGVEPAANIAKLANEAGIPTQNNFFGLAVAEDLIDTGHPADLVVANNVIAHVPDLQDFTAGLATVLKPGGVLSIEFPHLLNILEKRQFDTIYHEHFSYLSLHSLEPVLNAKGLEVFDVVQIPTHGGSLRVLAQRSDGPLRPAGPGLAEVRAAEKAGGLDRMETYSGYTQAVEGVLDGVRGFLARAKDEGKTVVGYGAAAKGTILLNSAGATPDQVAYVTDLNPHKQERFLPGTRIPIHSPDKIAETRPDYLLILVWNLKDEIMSQMAPIREWGGRFVLPIPQVEVLD